MKKTIRKYFVCCFIQWAFSAYAFAVPVPETGQSCYNDIFPKITSTSPYLLFLGRNAEHTPSYTKLSSDGNLLPDSATSWIMVKDNATGLIWEVKRNLDGISNYDDPNDADNTYTWYNGNSNTNGGYAGIPGNGVNTESFIKALNMAHFGGFSDWRLPTIKELTYLADMRSTNPSIKTNYFPNTASSWYWSSSTSANYPNQAWGVGFRHGYDSYNHKYFHGYVRAVRGGGRTCYPASSISTAVIRGLKGVMTYISCTGCFP